jgi:hypothetical protein
VITRTPAAYADPALDAFFPPLGPCTICGAPGLDGRHRIIDAIAMGLADGEGEGEMACGLLVSVEAVRTVREWSVRWPGART